MGKRQKTPEDFGTELQHSFDLWEKLKIHGCSDPFWSDGCNLNLVRNHIIYFKQQIEATMKPERYPDIYHRETPPETDRDYIARPAEIRANAQKSLAAYRADPDYQFLCRRVDRLTERQRRDTSIGRVIGYVVGLEEAIKSGDLIAMRRHENTSGYLSSFASCAKSVREAKPVENEQMNLFADYTDDGEDYLDE